MTSPWKIEHLRRPLFPLTRGKKNWYRVFISPSPPPPQVKFQRKPPSRFSVQSHRNFYIFLPIKINFSSSIDISSYAIEWIYLVLRGGGSKLRIAGISQLRLLHRALIAPGNFPTGFTALFSPVALECTLSPKGKRELRTSTPCSFFLSLSREREIRRTEKKDEIAVSSRRLFLV